MTVDIARKRRARRVASDEAHAWARSLRLDNPYGKTVLRALTLYVNGEGCCFVSIEQLAEDTDLSTDTVRRRLVWLETVGAIVRLPQWLDENGRRNGEGRGKRTTDEIRLLLDADPDEIERHAKGEQRAENSGVSASESGEISPSCQQGLNEAAENTGPRLALGQPLQSGEGLISEPEPEDSPQPPSGGSVALPDGWKEFQSDWGEPILRQSIAQQVWAALKPEERELACKAARGYVAWRKAQKKPPNVLGAHLFLKERDAWAEFAKRDPGSGRGIPNSVGIAADSVEGVAIFRLYEVARTQPFEHKGRVAYSGEITPQVLAFAEIGDRSKWLWIEDRQQIGAWSAFLGSHVFGARPQLLQTRGFGADQRSGIYAPWPWPPSATGKIYPTGPPEGLMSDQDFSDFK